MRRYLTALIVTCALNLTGAGAWADVVDRVIEQLRAQGFSQFEVSRTLLGRARIEARSERLEREIVVNPRTGEVLRDYWEEFDERGADHTDQTRDEEEGGQPDRDEDGDAGDDSGDHEEAEDAPDEDEDGGGDAGEDRDDDDDDEDAGEDEEDGDDET